MGQGRGNSALSVIMFVLSCDMANADTYVVGDKGGWRYNISTWPQGKSFKAGDILVFNYNSSIHNVVAVDEAGYKDCSVLDGKVKVYRTGHDSITLPQGQSYFVCGFPGHCQNGMKIAVTAACSFEKQCR